MDIRTTSGDLNNRLGTLNVDSQNQIRSLHGMMTGNGDVTSTSVNNRYGGVIDSAGWLTTNLTNGPSTNLGNPPAGFMQWEM